jgi:predicted N-formylglutamate amidohydrolase
MTTRARLVLSCEHGGNHVPAEVALAFASPLARQYLHSHRGWDAGALDAAQHLSDAFHVPLCQSTVSRLVVDLNRSLDHPQLHSRFTQNLPGEQREWILRQHYHPYRQRVGDSVRRIIEEGALAIHVAVHTFTPVFCGQRRKLDVGLLYDPSREGESRLCEDWQQILLTLAPALRIEMNQPYLGIDDGLPTALRRQFPADQYVGVELEINRRLFGRSAPSRQRMLTQLAESLGGALAKIEPLDA